jgi:hypothetical protein
MNWVRALRAFDEKVIDRRLGQALRRKDRRLLAIRSYSMYPNALHTSPDQLLAYVQRYGFRIIRGTSDAVIGIEQMTFVQSTFRFAEKFNQRLIARSSTGSSAESAGR